MLVIIMNIWIIPKLMKYIMMMKINYMNYQYIIKNANIDKAFILDVIIKII